MRPRFSYSVGEMVRIKVGAFQAFTGRIEEVNEEKATLKVKVSIFDRPELIELGFLDVEKLTFTEEE
jgi:transcription termination/antitermination protein NusG